MNGQDRNAPAKIANQKKGIHRIFYGRIDCRRMTILPNNVNKPGKLILSIFVYSRRKW